MRRAEAGLDAVPGAQAGDLRLDVLGQPAVGLGHVDPDRVAADRRALDAAQHASPTAAPRARWRRSGRRSRSARAGCRGPCRCAPGPGGRGRCRRPGGPRAGRTARAKATCSARVMSWSRKNSTLCCSSSARISAKRPSSREASARLTLRSSAPMVAVSGSTSIALGADAERRARLGLERCWSMTGHGCSPCGGGAGGGVRTRGRRPTSRRCGRTRGRGAPGRRPRGRSAG